MNMTAQIKPLIQCLQPEQHVSFSYTPVSASIAAVWTFDDHNVFNLGLTRSARAPQIQELLTDGFHHATRSYERGNPDLQQETSYNLEAGYRFNLDRVRAELDLFHNWAANYIFQQRDGTWVDEHGDPCAGSTECVPLLNTRQGDAVFKGYEAKVVIPLLENSYGLFDVTLFSDYTRGEFVQGGDVPRMPPLRYGLQLDHVLADVSSHVRLTRAEPQLHAGSYEIPAEGYLLLNLGTQYQIETMQDAKLMLYAKGNNLLNENVRNATSYLRNFAPEAGRGGEIGMRVSF